MRRLGRLCAFVLALAVLSLADPAASMAADPRSDEQWVLNAVQAPAAWALSRGAGVTVAVLDTGVDGTQPDLAGRVDPGPDLTGEQITPSAPHWGEHGTEMASLIAGDGSGGGGQGMVGVAPEARILPVRVTVDDDDPQAGAWRQRYTDSPPGTPDPVAEGIRYAVDHGAQVISMSLGTIQNSSTPAPVADQAAAVEYAVSHGVVVVAAAGNDLGPGNTAYYPAALPGVIAVGAVDRNGNVAGFSAQRWYTSLVAPGVGVPADLPHTTSEYIVANGTSLATALVAGTAALVKAVNPGLSPAQVKNLLETTASGKPPGGFSPADGFGTVDAVAALHAAQGERPASDVPQAAVVPAGAASAGAFPPIVSARPRSWWWIRAGVAGGAAVGFAVAAYVLASPMRRHLQRRIPPGPDGS